MGVSSASGFDHALRTAARLGPERRLWSRVRGRVESFLSAGDLSFDRNFLIVRPAIALCVILAAALPRVTERDYPQAGYRWSPGPPYIGVALWRYEGEPGRAQAPGERGR